MADGLEDYFADPEVALWEEVIRKLSWYLPGKEDM